MSEFRKSAYFRVLSVLTRVIVFPCAPLMRPNAYFLSEFQSPPATVSRLLAPQSDMKTAKKGQKIITHPALARFRIA
jgi:hypothetical protein